MTGPAAKRVLVLGGTGTIGRATVRELLRRGHEVVCLLRPTTIARWSTTPKDALPELSGATLRSGDVTDQGSVARDGFRGERFDAIVSCMSSRTGTPKDAWAVDHRAHVHALAAAMQAGVPHFVLLSAICVQKPLLAFQQAKLAFEQALAASGLTYSIVRPTAFFKSLSGQVERVMRGRPYLVFGDGTLTACKPISDEDLACFIADCLDDATRQNKIMPIGGPGFAQTPLEQGLRLFAMLGREPRIKQVPLALLDAIVAVLTLLGRVMPPLAVKAELARIGRYYATESMLVLDPVTGEYDAAATPSTGSDTLADFHARMIRGEASIERGDQAVF